MGIEAELFYVWNVATDLIALTGFILGYRYFGRSLESAVVGFIAFKIIQYLATPILLGLLAS